MDNMTKENLNKMLTESKEFKNSLMKKVIEEKVVSIEQAILSLAVYDNETMSQREFFRGMIAGLKWTYEDIDVELKMDSDILQKRELLQKEKKK